MMSLTFEPGQKLREGCEKVVLWCTGLISISVPAIVKTVLGFDHHPDLRRVHLDPNDRLAELARFERGGSLCRLETSASVKRIRSSVFSDEVIFTAISPASAEESCV
jgi:hypothetical protein